MTCNFEFLMSKAYPISDVVFCIYVSSLLSYNSIPEHSFRERNRQLLYNSGDGIF